MSIETPNSSSTGYFNQNRDERNRRSGGRDGFGIAGGSGGEKAIPHNTDAEEAVVGSLLIDRDTIIKIAPILRPADFFSEERAAVYEAILDLYEQRTPGDLITLRDELKRRGKLGEGEGQVKAATLFNLMHSTPSPVHVEHYAKIVLRYAIMRRLIGAGAQVTALGFDEQLETQEMVDQAQQLIYSVVQEGVKREAVKVGSILEEYFDRLAFLQENKGQIIGVPSGYNDLDKVTGGFQQSDLIILAARPATGKTSLALGFAYNIAMDKQNPRAVGVFSLEMSREQLVQRMLAMETGVDSHRLRTGYIDEEEWDRVSRAFGKLATAPLYIDDSAGISIMEMRSRARRLHAEYGIEILIIDYLQLMVGSRNENRQQEVSDISRNLKGLARELNIPVICLSQLSRAVESRTSHVPQLSDLRESGCLTGDSLVYLPDTGTHKRIDQLVGQSGFNVLALNTESWKLEPRPVLKAFATGCKPVYQLTTRLGRTIKATANHKFVTIHGWQRLDELSVGTRVALPRTLPAPTQSETVMSMSNAELALLGHLIGDGCTLPRHAIQYTTNDPTLAETVAKLAVEVFNDQVVPRVQKERNWYQVYLPPSYRLTHNVHNPIVNWLNNLGIFGLRSHEKYVPEVVFSQSTEKVALFLRHLWSTDGCIHLSEGANHYCNVYYASSSLKLAQNVQTLLLRLEINAKLSRRSQGSKGRDQYHVSINGSGDVKRFLKLVGGLGQNKTAHHSAITEYLDAKVANTNRDVLPREIWRRVAVPAMQTAGVTSRQMQAALGDAYCGTTLYKQNLSRERTARLAQAVALKEITRLAQSDVYWDEIVSIEPAGEAEVYDLTVEGLHNFVANCAIVHNSIEQDADVVMFIYREEMYNPETEKKNLAEIHISKHRNGPTGVVPLYFYSKTTRFANLEAYRQPGR